MRFPRPVDETLHGVTDYTAGATLTALLPRLVGVSGTPAGRQLRLSGAVHAGYSALTDYPLGVVRLIPYRAHLTLDAIGAVALAAAPFVMGDHRNGTRQWLPQVGAAIFEALSLLATDPSGQGDFHGDVEAVREANTIDPRDSIVGARAVKTGVAAGTVSEGAVSADA